MNLEKLAASPHHLSSLSLSLGLCAGPARSGLRSHTRQDGPGREQADCRSPGPWGLREAQSDPASRGCALGGGSPGAWRPALFADSLSEKEHCVLAAQRTLQGSSCKGRGRTDQGAGDRWGVAPPRASGPEGREHLCVRVEPGCEEQEWVGQPAFQGQRCRPNHQPHLL